MARRRDGIDGVLLVDKPEGPTSFDVIARLRRALGTRALGHTGTLDPLASGLLVVLAGRMTRLSAHLTADDKRYTALIRFGSRTTTDDRGGEVVEEGDPSGLTEARVRAALLARVGPQEQVPPAFSAVSIGGERLYAKARKGELVEAPPRKVVLRSLELKRWDPPDAAVDVACSKGTYIRALARDLGGDVGVPAHLAALRRTQSGDYSLDEALPLDALLEEGVAEQRLLTGPSAVRGMARLEVDGLARAALERGQRPRFDEAMLAPDETPQAGRVCLAVNGEDLVALVEVHEGHLHVVRGFGNG